MPWDHCDVTEITDDEACPSCGLTKDQWTIQVDATRTFTVSRRPIYRFELLDADDEPVADEPYALDLPNGDTKDGTLNEDGFAKVTSPRDGLGGLSFPDRAVGTVVCETDVDPPEDEQATLRQGAEGDEVAELQRRLTDLGYSLAVDGMFGPQTESAVRWFQEDKGLGVDGVCGGGTWGKLCDAATPPQSLPVPPPAVRDGDESSQVRKLQEALNQKASAGLTVDGKFGPRTEEALKAFQEQAGLEPDGVAGPNTWGSLLTEQKPARFTIATGRKVVFRLSTAVSEDFQLELHDATLPDDAVLVCEGLAAPLRYTASDRHEAERHRYTFPLPDPVPGGTCRATLETGGESYVLFEDVDLHGYVEHLTSDEPEPPFPVHWPLHVLHEDDPLEDPEDDGDGDPEAAGEEWPPEFEDDEDDVHAEVEVAAPWFPFHVAGHHVGEN